MSLSVRECADLLDPRRRLAQRILRDARSGDIQRFPALSSFPRQRPTFPIGRASREQDRELVSHSCHDNDIDSVGRFRGAVAHNLRISHPL
jgi:hypothetical protein